MAESDNPKQCSADYEAMAPYWNMVSDILSGADAMRAMHAYNKSVPGPAAPVTNLNQLNRARKYGAECPYLPRFQNETDEDYDCRRKSAPFTNIYGEVSTNLSAKPFGKPTELKDGAPKSIKNVAKNIDGQGSDLNGFAGRMFKSGLDYGISWALIEYTKVPPGVTLAHEREMGAGVYWVHVHPKNIIAVYSVFIDGKEIISHARILETTSDLLGYQEISVERVRVFNRELIRDDLGNVIGLGPASWELLEEVTNKDDSGKEYTAWIVVGEGPITIGIIPLVAFITGEREGTSWKVKPPLRDIAAMQVTSLQREANIFWAEIKTGNPILVGEGIPAPENGGELIVPVGPNAVLLAPPNGDGSNGTWKYSEISATGLAFMASRLDKLHEQMRELGMQPLSLANLTVTAAANHSIKAHSQCQKWALQLRQSLEKAFAITAQWLNESAEIEVNVNTDFGNDLSGANDFDSLIKLFVAKGISLEDFLAELKRRNLISPDANIEDWIVRIASDQEGQQLQPEKMIDPVTGQPLVVTPQHGVPNPPPVLQKPALN